LEGVLSVYWPRTHTKGKYRTKGWTDEKGEIASLVVANHDETKDISFVLSPGLLQNLVEGIYFVSV